MDRRTVWAILLMMAIAVAPALFIKRQLPVAPRGAPAKTPAGNAAAGGGAAAPAGPARNPTDTATPSPALPSVGQPADAGVAVAARTVWVASPLYRYGFSTAGGRMVAATLPQYRSMVRGEHGPVQILPANSELLDLTLVAGRDTVRLRDWVFTTSADSLVVTAPTSLTLVGERGGLRVELTYSFRPDEYQVGVVGRVSGIGPNGGSLLVGMGPSLVNTEVDSLETRRALALVTKHGNTERTDFSKLRPGERRTLSGPFEWTAVKSKYFVTALLAVDSTAATGEGGGGISGVTLAVPATAGKNPTEAQVQSSLPVPAAGTFRYSLYAGPMEYQRLARIGHDFDDVNPFGWPGVRMLIHAVAGPVRWLLVWMHDHLHLAYGVVLIIFGVLVRIILWPLNQKAMRANMQMQAIQPLMKDLQERYKNDPQRMQQEMFKLYREHNVNPFGGCWPMLLPAPVMFALYFVFQNAIELRGAPFLWIPDLSRPDPFYIIPIVMGISMFALTKIGQLGMEPNPQAKTMLYMMPVMMTAFFLFLPGGLNLYYMVSNLVSIPQQWLIAKERQKRSARVIVNVKTAPTAAGTSGSGSAKRKKKS